LLECADTTQRAGILREANMKTNPGGEIYIEAQRAFSRQSPRLLTTVEGPIVDFSVKSRGNKTIITIVGPEKPETGRIRGASKPKPTPR
jgi:hypothetical protein